MKKEFFRSPLFYVGDKYKLLPQLTKYFPKKIDRFIEPFVGGGSVFLNTNAKSYLLNDFDKKLIGLQKYLYFVKDNHNNLFKNIAKIIDKYNLSKSYQKNIISTSLKKKYPKTYYAQFNKKNYTRLKDDFNKNKNTNYIILYILLIFGFNRILRFNSKGKFNLPVGNVDFNKNVIKALNNYFETVKKKKINFFNLDYVEFIKKLKLNNNNDFIYFDPPYLIAASEYNKNWKEKNEIELYEILDKLNISGIKWMLSNVLIYRGKINKILKNWSKKYKIKRIKSNYISFNDNRIKNFKEILIKNY